MRVQVVPGASMHLSLETSSPRRAFKESLGQANHFLITILVGLDAIEDGTAKQRPSMPASWNPQNPAKSAARSRGFAARAAFALLFDCIDAYTRDILAEPTIVQSEASHNAIEGAADSRARFEELARLAGQKDSSAWALLNVGRVWRHRLIHTRSNTTPDGAVVAALRQNKDAIKDEYAGLDIDKLQKSLVCGEPHMKETTAMIRAGHQFVEAVDRDLLTGIDLSAYAKEALSSHLRPLDLTERKVRASNLWGQDRDRRLRAVLNILRSKGMTVSIEKGDGGTGRTIDQLVDLKPREVLQALGCA
jgi:hypothetical protein